MPITVKWHDLSHRILHYRFAGEWTWDEYYSALAQGRRMEKEAAHAVCTINDMRQTQHVPMDFMEQARAVSLTRPTTTAIAVFISDDYHFTKIYDLLVRLYPDTSTIYPLARSEAAALALIRDWFNTHPDTDADL